MSLTIGMKFDVHLLQNSLNCRLAFSRVAVLPTRQNSNWQHWNSWTTAPNHFEIWRVRTNTNRHSFFKIFISSHGCQIHETNFFPFSSKYPITFECASRLERNFAQWYNSLWYVIRCTINYSQCCQIYKTRISILSLAFLYITIEQLGQWVYIGVGYNYSSGNRGCCLHTLQRCQI